MITLNYFQQTPSILLNALTLVERLDHCFIHLLAQLASGLIPSFVKIVS